jgi:hypothetical protein
MFSRATSPNVVSVFWGILHHPWIAGQRVQMYERRFNDDDTVLKWSTYRLNSVFGNTRVKHLGSLNSVIHRSGYTSHNRLERSRCAVDKHKHVIVFTSRSETHRMDSSRLHGHGMDSIPDFFILFIPPLALSTFVSC